MKAAEPTGHFGFAHRIKDLAELVHRLIRIGLGRGSRIAVEFLVIVIIRFPAHRRHEVIALTDIMLPATSLRPPCCGRRFARRFRRLLLPAAEESGSGGKHSQTA